ncbi:MAG: septum formation initiator family protein [Chitinophagaceae bacterium]|nr:MAG: septum formation initiator family protein [Chitinophagaceae bacterium]
MKLLNQIPAWLKSKYFLCSAGFIVWMIFFDPRDLYTQLERSRELKELQASKQHYQQQMATEKHELEQLKNNPATLEKYAREKYLMKRDNEDLFVVPENSATLNK